MKRRWKLSYEKTKYTQLCFTEHKFLIMESKKMELHKFLSLLAAFSGLIGAVFLSKGVLALSPEAMLDLTPPHSRIGYSPEIIASLAAQKSDTLIGVMFIGIAFLVQIISLLFVNDEIHLFKSRWLGFWVVLAIISFVTIIFSLADIKINTWYKHKMGKIEIRQKFGRIFSRKKFDLVEIQGLKPMSEQLLDFGITDSEVNSTFIKNLARYVEYQIPNNIDLSQFDTNDE